MHDFKFSIFLTHGYYSYRSLTIVYVKSYKLIKMADVGILSRILEIQRSRVSKDPDMDNVFLSLLSKGFFSKFEEKQILNAIDPEDRTNILLDKVSRKPGSFRDICLALEEYAPHLLTHLLLDIGGVNADNMVSQSVAPIGEEERGKLMVNRRLDSQQEVEFPKRSGASGISGTQSHYQNGGVRSDLHDGYCNGDKEGPTDEVCGHFLWQTHRVDIPKVAGYGFGIAVSGGFDSPYFANGDPSIVISDVLRYGPAEGRLLVDDRIVSVNGISLEGATHSTAIQSLRSAGGAAHLVIRRRTVLPDTSATGTLPMTVTLVKKGEDCAYGLRMGCWFYVQDILPGSLADEEDGLSIGDVVLKIDGVSTDGLSLDEVNRIVNRGKDRLHLTLSGVDRSTEKLRQLSPSRSTLDDGEDSPERGTVPRSSLGSDVRFDGIANRDPSTTRLGGLLSSVGVPMSGAPQPFLPHWTDVREVVFEKDCERGLGLRLAGGNATGIFLASVQRGGVAESHGLVEGDQILQANGQDIVGLTREEAVAHLTGLVGLVSLVVQCRMEDYEAVMLSHVAGDSFYIRTHFSHQPEEGFGDHSFATGDIFHVKDSLFGGVDRSWLASRVGPNGEGVKRGRIPTLKQAEELSRRQQLGSVPVKDRFLGKGRSGNLFKRRSARRSKSLSKDHWEEVIFSGLSSKFPAYERVVLRDPAFVRPVVVFGAIADVARERLLASYPEIFELPHADQDGVTDLNKPIPGIARFSAIRATISREKHCVLDVTPHHVDQMNYAQFYPIVILLRAGNRQAIKDVRRHGGGSAKDSKKLHETDERMETLYSHLFTGILSYNSTDAWFPQLVEIIAAQQRRPVWMSERKPEEHLNDDLMFPMPSGFSVAVSPDPDADGTQTADAHDSSSTVTKPLARSSSDPNMSVPDPVPWVPPYPAPPMYRRDEQSQATVGRPGYLGDKPSSVGPAVGTGRQAETVSGAPYVSPSVSSISRLTPSMPSNGQNATSPSATHRRSQSHEKPGLPRTDRRSSGPASPLGPYRFTRSTAVPVPGCSIDRAKLDRLSSRYRRGGKVLSTKQHLSPIPDSGSFQRPFAWGPPRKKESPPPVPVKRHTLKDIQRQAGVPSKCNPGSGRPSDHNDTRLQHYHHSASASPRGYLQGHGPLPETHLQPTQLYNLSPKLSSRQMVAQTKFASGIPADDFSLPRDSFQPSPRQQVSLQQAYGNPVYVGNGEMDGLQHFGHPVGEEGSFLSERIYSRPRTDDEQLDALQAMQSRSGLRSASNVTDVPKVAFEPDMTRCLLGPYQEAGISGQQVFNSYKNLLTPAFYGNRGGNPRCTVQRPQAESQPYVDEQLVMSSASQISDARVSVGDCGGRLHGLCSGMRPPEFIPPPSPAGEWDGPTQDADEDQNVIATASGLFTSAGGVLRSAETGVSVVVPAGAIDPGISQEIYFKVCKGTGTVPPLNEEQGETLLSPLVMCGPHGLSFRKPVELHLPHSASSSLDKWSMALKSTDTLNGQMAQWHDVALVGSEGVSHGSADDRTVSVLVDRF